MADGLKDEYSSTTFDSSLYFQDVEIVKGRDIETKIVYLVKGHSTNLIYNIMDYVVWVRALNKLIIMELKVYHELARELLLTMHISTVSHLPKEFCDLFCKKYSAAHLIKFFIMLFLKFDIFFSIQNNKLNLLNIP